MRNKNEAPSPDTAFQEHKMQNTAALTTCSSPTGSMVGRETRVYLYCLCIWILRKVSPPTSALTELLILCKTPNSMAFLFSCTYSNVTKRKGEPQTEKGTDPVLSVPTEQSAFLFFRVNVPSLDLRAQGESPSPAPVTINK